MPKIENIFNFDASAVIAQDVDLVGEVTIGANCIIHPSCTIVALGPIIFGSGCIVEEQSVICNRRKTPMQIGEGNLFSVGCRVEASGIGSWNVFEGKSRVSGDVVIGSHCVIGAGCTVVYEPVLGSFLEAAAAPPGEASDSDGSGGQQMRRVEDYSVVFGDGSTLSCWSGEGSGQAKALHAKHLLYLAETLPKFHRTRSTTTR